MHGKDAANSSYPAMFHVGFVVEDESKVRERISA